MKAAPRGTLAASPLLFQHSIHIIHFTQSLKKRDQIQQLSVRHVVKPGGYGDLEVMKQQSRYKETRAQQMLLRKYKELSIKMYYLKRKIDLISIKRTYSIVWVEDVRCWRIVHNDDFIEVPAQSAQVLDIISTMENAGLPKQTAAKGTPLI